MSDYVEFSKFWMSDDSCLEGSKIEAMQSCWNYQQNKIQILKESLEHIKTHMETSIKGEIGVSVPWVIADKALSKVKELK